MEDAVDADLREKASHESESPKSMSENDSESSHSAAVK